MATTIHMRCGGCDAEKEVAIRREFRSFDGRRYGFGTYHTPTIDEAVEPTGWTWSDLIGCTYCPTCWEKIENYEPATVADELEGIRADLREIMK